MSHRFPGSFPEISRESFPDISMAKDFELFSNFPNLISEISFEPKKSALIISEVELVKMGRSAQE